jgi:sodium-dependent dicarboxylate transporter 2/3/5
MIDLKKLLHNTNIFIGPLVFIILLFSNPLDLEPPAARLMGVMGMVVVWWLLTDIPLHITGIIGVCVSIVMGVEKSKVALSSFSHPLIFLFMGGFFLAKAMEVNGIHRRAAMRLLLLPVVGGNSNRIFIATMIITAVFSMFLSNTATTAIMLPIVAGIIAQLDLENESESTYYLFLAYAATIGGLGTPIGSPPNIIAIGFLENIAKISISFIEWMFIGIPIVVVLLTGLCILGVKKINLGDRKIDVEFIRKEIKNLGRLGKRDIFILFIILVTFIGWLLPGLFAMILGKKHEISLIIKNHLSESIVVMLTTSSLFLFPLKGDKCLNWKNASTIDWGTLLLFGSGISLGKMMFSTGLAREIGEAYLHLFGASSLSFFILCLIVFSITFTEFASNTASANLLIPIIIVTATKMNLTPVIPVLATAIACNLAFSLPVATPPNAIVYGSGKIKLLDMVKWGALMNIFSTIVVFVFLLILSHFSRFAS